jgi:SAM-dependent methyltransferase
MKGRWILDAGCGAGRFLDVASTTGAQVVGVDLSNAVDAAAESLQANPTVHLVQASIYELPFRPGAFDGVYCIGVIQHTPDPARAVAALPPQLKKGGRLALTIYERRRFTKLYSKYLLRSLTRRLDKNQLLRGVQATMPLLFPMTEVLFRVPVLGRYLRFLIPVANYTEEPDLTWQQRYHWAVLDTYDMLAPEYDEPQTFERVRDTLVAAGVVDLQRLPNPGLNLVAQR